jgi:hypothetical protein
MCGFGVAAANPITMLEGEKQGDPKEMTRQSQAVGKAPAPGSWHPQVR